MARVSSPMAADQGNHTDIAALASSLVAVVLALFLVPGTYTAINLIVSFVLVAIIFGYVWPNKRQLAQSVAVAAALALACIPAVGFFVEGALAPSSFRHFAIVYDQPE